MEENLNLRLYPGEGTHFDTSIEEMVEKKLNSFIGWKCGAGVQSLYIDHTGKIQAAECGSIGQYGKNGDFGNIFGKFNFDTEWINCAKKFCVAPNDLTIPRFRKTSAKDYLTLTQGEDSKTTSSSELVKPLAMERLHHSYQKQVIWELIKDHNNLPNIDLLKQAAENLEAFCHGESIHFKFIKCDPTGHPFFLHWASYLFNKGHTLHTPTNGRRTPKYYQELIHYSDLQIQVGETQGEDDLVDLVSDLLREINTCKKSRIDIGTLEIDLNIIIDNEVRLNSIKQKLSELPFYSDYCKLTTLTHNKIVEDDVIQSSPDKNVESKAIITDHRILCCILMRNCENSISEVVGKFRGELEKYVSEILVIDNDSRDGSIKAAQKALDSVSPIKTTLIKNHLNYGFGESHKTAFKYALDHHYDYLLMVHGDNSGDANQFLGLIEDGSFKKYDMVLSQRLSSKSIRYNYPVYRLIGNKILSFIATCLTFKPIHDFNSGPVNMYRVETFINKFERPVDDFSGSINFPQYVLLYGILRRCRYHYRLIDYREAGGKSFYSSLTQFVKGVILLIRFKVTPRASLKVIPKIQRSGQLYKEIRIKY